MKTVSSEILRFVAQYPGIKDTFVIEAIIDSDILNPDLSTNQQLDVIWITFKRLCKRSLIRHNLDGELFATPIGVAKYRKGLL